MVQALVGHERDGVTQRNYFAAGYTVSQSRDALEKLRFDDASIAADGSGFKQAEKAAERAI